MPRVTEGSVKQKEGDEHGRWEVRYDYTLNGERKTFRALKWTEAAADKLLAAELKKLKEVGPAGVRGARMRFGDLCDLYEKKKLIDAVYRNGRKIRGKRSVGPAKAEVKVLREYFGKKHIGSFTHDDVEQFKHKRQDTPTKRANGKGERQVSSINRELERLRTMLNFAVQQGFISEGQKPFRKGDGLISKADETTRERVLSYEEEERLLAALGPRTLTYTRKKHKRNGHRIPATEIEYHDTGASRAHLKALVIAGVDTAARLSELTRLKWRSVDFVSRKITLEALTTKTAKRRVVGMTDRLVTELESLWQQSPKKPDMLVFGIKSPKKAFTTACAVAGLTDFVFHDLRHTCITRWIDANVPHTRVMKLSGHRQFSTFEKYVNEEDDTAQGAAEKLDAHNRARAAALTTAVETVQ